LALNPLLYGGAMRFVAIAVSLFALLVLVVPGT
jgi:hypothetical protein